MEKKLDLSSFGIKPEELTRKIESGASIKLKKLMCEPQNIKKILKITLKRK